MPYAAVNRLNMYYEVHGEGPPLLLLHGGTGSIPAKWIPFFSTQFRVIAMEQMGHGRTADVTDRPFRCHDMAEDTVELMRQLEIESAVVVGFSDGGIIGLDMAIHHPERVTKLVVTGANSRTDGYTGKHWEAVNADPDDWPVSEAYGRLSPDGVEHARGDAEHQGADPDHRRRPRPRHAGARRRNVQDDPWRATVCGSARRPRGHAEGHDPDVSEGSAHR